jgi:peptidoglycan/LPS O-acetylase OafA/YrhL
LIFFLVEHESSNTSFYSQVTVLSLSPISAMFLLPFAAHWRTGRGLLAKAITHISKISYSMYLINLALVAEVIRDNFPPTTEVDRILKYFVYWFFVVAGSTLLYKYFERPVMNLRDK